MKREKRQPRPRNKKAGQFFAIDRRIWAHVCDLGSVNEAVTYLVLAQGTGRDNYSTRWSVTSLKRYAGISWQRGTLAVENLIRRGLVRRSETSTQKKPVYELIPWSEIVLARLSDNERRLLNEITSHQFKFRHRDQEALVALQQKGLIQQQSGSYLICPPASKSADSDLIWLPNTIVTGTCHGEESPVRRLRTEDVWTVRLFIDLYHAQNLRDDGGISPKVLWQKYLRKKAGEQGIFDVWAFRADQRWLTWIGPFKPHESRPKTDEQHPVWTSISRLQKHGLLVFVPHLWENEYSDQTEVIHSYGIGQSGEPLEIEIGRAAHQAGLAMVPAFKREQAIVDGYYHFAPIKNTLPNVQMIGVARLHYRPAQAERAPGTASL